MKQTHVVDDGRVFCALQRRAVDVISCFGCERVLEIDLDSRRPKVVCAIPAPGEQAVTAT